MSIIAWDCIGQDVNYAERICELPAGGQVIASELMAVFLRNAKLADVVIHPLGTYELIGDDLREGVIVGRLVEDGVAAIAAVQGVIPGVGGGGACAPGHAGSLPGGPSRSQY
jgi:hypothetical protein